MEAGRLAGAPPYSHRPHIVRAPGVQRRQKTGGFVCNSFNANKLRTAPWPSLRKNSGKQGWNEGFKAEHRGFAETWDASDRPRFP